MRKADITMSAIMTSRGRVLTRQQVRFSEAPVRLSSPACAPASCQHEAPGVSITTDPDTGDVMEIVVRCNCGEITVVKCGYEAVSEES